MSDMFIFFNWGSKKLDPRAICATKSQKSACYLASVYLPKAIS